MKIRIVVKDGECQGGHHTVGEVFEVERTTPGGMCLSAWDVLAPYVTALRCGANFPWEQERGYALSHCPDPNGITLELRRIEEV